MIPKGKDPDNLLKGIASLVVQKNSESDENYVSYKIPSLRLNDLMAKITSELCCIWIDVEGFFEGSLRAGEMQYRLWVQSFLRWKRGSFGVGKFWILKCFRKWLG